MTDRLRSGLGLTDGFNHMEAVRAFRAAQALDPECAMCYWGEAYALGPNINKVMDPADNPRAVEAARLALDKAGGRDRGGAGADRGVAGALLRRAGRRPGGARCGVFRGDAGGGRPLPGA